MFDNIFGSLFEEHKKKWAQIEELSESIKKALADTQPLDQETVIRQTSQLVLHLVDFLKPPDVADLDKSLAGFKDELSKVLSQGKK